LFYRIEKIKTILDKLPSSNRAMIIFLIYFLQEVIISETITKMTSHNLSIVFAPTLLWTEDAMKEAINSTKASKSIKIIIDKYQEFFMENERPE